LSYARIEISQPSSESQKTENKRMNVHFRLIANTPDLDLLYSKLNPGIHVLYQAIIPDPADSADAFQCQIYRQGGPQPAPQNRMLRNSKRPQLVLSRPIPDRVDLVLGY
jgi:hypothetical protein